MSATIGDLIDRTYREYLEPMDDLTSYTTLGSTISASATTLNFNGDLLSIEEEDAMDAGAIVEIGQELMICTDLNAVTNTLTVTRGARGTTAVQHLADSIIKIAPVFPRKNVFDAISDQIHNLYPTLFAVETISVNAATGYTILGAHGTDQDNNNYLVAPLKAISQYTDFSAGSDSTGIQYRGVQVELIDLPNPFTYVDNAGTSRTKTYNNGPNVVHAVQTYNIASGHVVYITFKKKFLDVRDYDSDGDIEDTTLAQIGLETEYEPIIMTGVAAQLMSGRDIPTATADYISDQMGVTNFPVESASRIRNSLLAYQRALIQQARKDLRARYPEPVSINSISYG